MEPAGAHGLFTDRLLATVALGAEDGSADETDSRDVGGRLVEWHCRTSRKSTGSDQMKIKPECVGHLDEVAKVLGQVNELVGSDRLLDEAVSLPGIGRKSS